MGRVKTMGQGQQVAEVKTLDVRDEVGFQKVDGTQINPPAQRPEQGNDQENGKNNHQEVVKGFGGYLLVDQLVGVIHD